MLLRATGRRPSHRGTSSEMLEKRTFIRFVLSVSMWDLCRPEGANGRDRGRLHPSTAPWCSYSWSVGGVRETDTSSISFFKGSRTVGAGTFLLAYWDEVFASDKLRDPIWTIWLPRGTLTLTFCSLYTTFITWDQLGSDTFPSPFFC